MQRNYKAYIRDVLEAIEKIEKYTRDMGFEEFAKDELVQDGVVRNLEVVGEAVKQIPEHVKDRKPGVEWRKIAGLRDILIHGYFGVDLEIVWDIVKRKLPEFKEKVSELLFEVED